jgi:hypothetical protein
MKCFVCEFKGDDDYNFMANGLYLVKRKFGESRTYFLRYQFQDGIEICPIMNCPICGRPLNKK